MKIRTSSWLFAVLATAICIGIFFAAASCEAAQNNQVKLIVRPAKSTANHAISNGDSTKIYLDNTAKVYLTDSKSYYFKVIKNGQEIATITAKDKHGIIFFGEYRFDVYSTNSNKLIASMNIYTQPSPMLWEAYPYLLIAIIITMIAWIIRIVRKVRNERAIRRFQKEHPPTITDVKWQ